MPKVNNLAVEASSFELQARPELLDIIDGVAKDKGILAEEVFDAMEAAIKKVASMKYGTLYNIRVKINRSNGSISVQKVTEVVEEVENPYHQVSLEEALVKNPNISLGDEIVEYLPNPDFARGSVQSFRQVVIHKVKEAERQREYEFYKDKVGEIVSGVVKRVEFGNVFVELTNRADAILRRDQCIPRENMEVGNRVRALILDIKKDSEAAQIFLTRNHSDFIKKLFAQEVPEVYEGVVEIKAVARDAGSRSKVAVISKDPSIDPVSVCVGFKGANIHGVLNELKGEKIDLVHWSDSIATFVVNAFHPTQIAKVIVDEDKKNIDVVVPAEGLSLAIGRRGQNINLISKLVGWNIDIMSEETEKERRQKLMQDKIAYFKDSLDVDDVIAQLLVVEGFNSAKDILDNSSDLASVPGFNQEIIDELKSRSTEFLRNHEQGLEDKLKDLDFEEGLLKLMKNHKDVLFELAKNNVKTLNDFADLSSFDLLDMLNGSKASISQEEADKLILKARNINNN